METRSQTQTHWRRPPRLLYAALLFLRLYLALYSTGYIHPDEHFQSTEAALGTYKTWEFDARFPVRSMASVRMWNGAVVAAAASPLGASSPRLLFCTQRLAYFALSLVGDAVLPSWPTRLLYASSGAVLTFSIRPFSNCIEAAVLAASLATVKAIASNATSSRGHVSLSLLFGVLLSAGFFARFTFAVFALPVGVWFLVVQWRRRSIASPAAAITAVAAAAISFVATCTAHILYDTRYYRASAPVIAPLNAMRYNSQRDNLALHGLHPRWLHIAVNAPMICGVGVWVVVVSEGWTWLSRSAPGQSGTRASTERNPIDNVKQASSQRTPMSRSSSPPSPPSTSTPPASTSRRASSLRLVALGTITTSLAILSSQPHQEPRFLLPLVVPCLWMLGSKKTLPRWLITLHAIQSIAMVLFFGIAHQAGVVPSLLHISERYRHGAVNAKVYTWRKFMPPRHLVRSNNQIEDLGGSAAGDVIQKLLGQNNQPDDASAAAASPPRVLIAPTWALSNPGNGTEFFDEIVFHPAHTFFPHLDMDHLEETIQAYRKCRRGEMRRGQQLAAYPPPFTSLHCFRDALSVKVLEVRARAPMQMGCRRDDAED